MWCLPRAARVSRNRDLSRAAGRACGVLSPLPRCHVPRTSVACRRPSQTDWVESPVPPDMSQAEYCAHQVFQRQIMLTPAELKALDDWRFAKRMQSRASAVRELSQSRPDGRGIQLGGGRDQVTGLWCDYSRAAARKTFREATPPARASGCLN